MTAPLEPAPEPVAGGRDHERVVVVRGGRLAPALRMPPHRRAELRHFVLQSRQLVLLAAVTGVATGLVVAGFDRIVVDGLFDHVGDAPLWCAALLPGTGLLVAGAARRWLGPRATPSTADEYLHAFHDRHHELRWRPLVARLIAAIATLGSGAPMGLEGPSLYAGATIGSRLQRRFSRTFDGADYRVLLAAGAAAGVSAIFKAPATGAIFAIEVPYQGDVARRMLLPALVASASGYLVFAAINGTDPLFPISGNIGFVYRDLLGAAAIGIISGVGARGFAWMLRHAKGMSAGPHPWRTTLAAGAVIALTFVAGRLLTGSSIMLGAGYEVVAWASDPGRAIWLLGCILVLRCLATSAAVAGGGVGGLFIPLVAAGALVGVAVGHVVSPPDLDLFLVIGVAAFLGAGYRVPLASVMFVAETTGRPAFVVPGLIAAVAAELVMGPASVTRYQRTDRTPSTIGDEAPPTP